MQHAPDVDVIFAFNVEHEMGIILHLPAAQSRQVELMGVARRAGDRITFDVPQRLLKRIHESQSRLLCALAR